TAVTTMTWALPVCATTRASASDFRRASCRPWPTWSKAWSGCPTLATPAASVCARGHADITFYAPVSVAILLRSAVASVTLPANPSWQSLERLFDHVHQEWSAQPRHRDPIFARDRWRCAVPAYTSRRNLHDHHLLFRSRGGGNARDNHIT